MSNEARKPESDLADAGAAYLGVSAQRDVATSLPESDYWLKRDGEQHVTHLRRIGSGGYGEVHEVPILDKVI
jgi:hypothetical protein